jgi:hypothetical protein
VNIAKRQLELKTLNELVDSLGKKQPIRKVSNMKSRKTSDVETKPSISEIFQQHKEQQRLSKEPSG